MKKILALLIVVMLTTDCSAQYSMPVKRVHDSWHFIGGYGAGMMISLTGNTPRDRIMRGAFGGAVLGIAKEGYDLYNGGKPSGVDVVITTAGSVVGALVVNWAFKQAKKHRDKPCKM